MATVERRTPRSDRGKVSYRVRYRDPTGAQRSKSFATKAEARVFAATVEADMARGHYLDLALGKVTVGEYAEQWLGVQSFKESTREAVSIRVRKHIVPALGHTQLGRLRSSDVQAWVRGLQQTLSPATVEVVFSTLSTVLAAAVDDGCMAKNPATARSVRLPRKPSHKIVPWTDEEVVLLGRALPHRYAVLMPLITGLGLRQGEAFGLAVDDVDFMRQVVQVRRQVKIVGSRLVFDLPKYGKVREVPLAPRVGQLLAAHLQDYPAHEVSLPWEVPDGRTAGAALVLTSREGKALNRNYINSRVWHPARTAAGMVAARQNGMHGGRHYYASAQLEGGTSIRALADYLGHGDPGFTLRTYTHLMPAAEPKARDAIESVYRRLDLLDVEPAVAPL